MKKALGVDGKKVRVFAVVAPGRERKTQDEPLPQLRSWKPHVRPGSNCVGLRPARPGFGAILSTASSPRSLAEDRLNKMFRSGSVSRRVLGLAAVGFIILTWPSLTVGQQSEPLRRLRNHIHQDMTTCIAFFRQVSRCLAKNPQYAKTAAAYARATDDLLYKSILLGKQIGLSEQDAKLRLGTATDEMADLINKDCGNISLLLGKHLDKCTAVASDPLNPLKNAAPKP